MNNEYVILISSCDAFSDLWEKHFYFFKKHWKGPFPKIYLVTDKETSFNLDGVIVKQYSGDMPQRLKQALLDIIEDYVFVTLDDYFVIDDIDVASFSQKVQYCIDNHVDYYCLYGRKYAKGYSYKGKNVIKPVDMNNHYALNLYPAFWKRVFLIDCVKDDLSPWDFEPTLRDRAIEKNAICLFDNNKNIVILDVIRKGRLLHKADKYLKKAGLPITTRKLAKRSNEFMLAFKDFIKWHTPKWFFRFTKKVAIKMGMKFYSKDEI